MSSVRSWQIFDEIGDAIEDGVHDGLVQAAEDELEAAEQAYDNEEDVLGRPWKELSPETIRKKGHDTILVESGVMRASGFVKDNKATDTVRVGFNDRKVPIHEFGTEDIPARPIIEPMRLDLRHNRLRSAIADSVGDSIGTVSVRRGGL